MHGGANRLGIKNGGWVEGCLFRFMKGGGLEPFLGLTNEGIMNMEGVRAGR